MSTLLAFHIAMKPYGAISCVKMYFDQSRSCLHYHGFCDHTMQDRNSFWHPANPQHLNTAILHHLHYYDRRLFSCIIKLHLPGYELTETCERQVWNNTRSRTVWSAIWGSWCCCSGSTACGRRSGPWSRSWRGHSWCCPTAVVSTGVITTHRPSLTIGSVGYENGRTLTECRHDVDETETRTAW